MFFYAVNNFIVVASGGHFSSFRADLNVFSKSFSIGSTGVCSKIIVLFRLRKFCFVTNMLMMKFH